MTSINIGILLLGISLPLSTVQPQMTTIKNEFVIGEKVPRYVEESKPKRKKQYKNISNDDFDLLCDIVMAEVENQSQEVQYYIACVVLNRVKSNQYPNTLREVVYQPYQFSCINDGRFSKVAGKPSRNVQNAVRKAIEHNRLDNDVLYFTSNGYLCGTKPWKKLGDMYLSKKF